MEFSINSTLERVQKTSTSNDDVISVDMRDVTVMEMVVSADALFATEMDQSPGWKKNKNTLKMYMYVCLKIILRVLIYTYY